MDQRWILAAVLVPALAWPACNGGTENLGEDGDGGSAGQNFEGDSSAGTTRVTIPVTGGPVTVVGPATVVGAGGAGSGGISTTGMNANSGDGAGGFGVDGALADSVGFANAAASNTVVGAGGDYGGVGGSGGVGSINAGPVGAGGAGGPGTVVGAGGAGGTSQTYAGADLLHDSSTQVITLTSDADQLYAGGSRITAIPLPNGPANVLGNGNTDLRLAVDDTDLYVCSTGGMMYRMSKNGGGTQNYQGADVGEGECGAVSVDDTMIHAAWLDPAYGQIVIRSWLKSDRTAPQDGVVVESTSPYVPYLIANEAVYYASRTDEELLLGRILLDDYSDEALLSVDAEFDSEYIVPLAAKGDDLYFQSCEQTNRWCSLFVQHGADNEPIPYEQFQRDSVIKSLALVNETVIVALPEGIHALETTEGELKPIWIHPSMVNYGPLIARGKNLYFVSNPVYSTSMVWHLPL